MRHPLSFYNNERAGAVRYTSIDSRHFNFYSRKHFSTQLLVIGQRNEADDASANAAKPSREQHQRERERQQERARQQNNHQQLDPPPPPFKFNFYFGGGYGGYAVLSPPTELPSFSSGQHFLNFQSPVNLCFGQAGRVASPSATHTVPRLCVSASFGRFECLEV